MVHPMSARVQLSGAVRRLRTWVTAAAGVVCLAAALQVGVFGATRYTNIRWTDLAPPADPAAVNVPLTVIEDAPAASKPPAPAPPGAPAVAAVHPIVGPVHTEEPAKPTDVNRAQSTMDAVMRRISAVAVAAGVIAAPTLGLLTMLGVVVAGGSRIAGVERAVTACTWAIVLGVICVPWGDATAAAVPTVFSSYGAVTHANDGGRVGEVELLARYAVLPIVALVLSVLVCAWFRSGVANAVLPKGLTAQERAAEEEMETIRNKGVAGRVPRALAALNQVLDETEKPAEGQVPDGDDAQPTEAISPSLRRRDAPSPRVAPKGRPLWSKDTGDGLQRPI